MLNIIFCGYRSWALSIIEDIIKHPKVNCIDVIHSNEEYHDKVNSFGKNIDFILFLGWSWIIPSEITEKYLCLGIHPSNLPDYRGGSPLQHQIINGILDSKVTLMTLSSKKLDGGEIWMKEDFNLRGNNMEFIFSNLIRSSTLLLNKFVDNFSNLKPKKPNLENGSYFKRRKPNESNITIKQIKKMTLEELYNFIRALSDPYPNAYLEDEKGNKLLFKNVEYVRNNS